MPRIADTRSTGEIVGAKTSRRRIAKLTKCAPRKPFLFFAHPERWGVILGLVVPLLGTLPFTPGVNGVSKTGDPSLAIAKKKKEGWIEIPWDVRGRGTSYLRRHKGVKGYVHTSEWETPHLGSDVVTSDQEGYVQFLEWLVEEDIIPQPELYVLDALRDKAQSRANDYGAKAHASPQFRTAFERALREVETIEEYILEVSGELPESEGESVGGSVADLVANAEAASQLAAAQAAAAEAADQKRLKDNARREKNQKAKDRRAKVRAKKKADKDKADADKARKSQSGREAREAESKRKRDARTAAADERRAKKKAEDDKAGDGGGE